MSASDASGKRFPYTHELRSLSHQHQAQAKKPSYQSQSFLVTSLTNHGNLFPWNTIVSQMPD